MRTAHPVFNFHFGTLLGSPCSFPFCSRLTPQNNSFPVRLCKPRWFLLLSILTNSPSPCNYNWASNMNKSTQKTNKLHNFTLCCTPNQTCNPTNFNHSTTSTTHTYPQVVFFVPSPSPPTYHITIALPSTLPSTLCCFRGDRRRRRPRARRPRSARAEVHCSRPGALKLSRRPSAVSGWGVGSCRVA